MMRKVSGLSHFSYFAWICAKLALFRFYNVQLFNFAKFCEVELNMAKKNALWWPIWYMYDCWHSVRIFLGGCWKWLFLLCNSINISSVVHDLHPDFSWPLFPQCNSSIQIHIIWSRSPIFKLKFCQAQGCFQFQYFFSNTG